MSFANDKISLPARYIAGNAQLIARLRSGGIQNVVLADSCQFASGNRLERRVFIGETAPGTNYDSYASIGDEYIQVVFTSSVPSEAARYIFTSNGFEKIITEFDGDYYADVTLTSAQVKALKATPITIVAAPGTNLAIVPTAINIVCNYGGTNAFTETDDDISIGYSGGAEIKEIEATGLIDQTNDEWRYITFEHAETFIPEENTAVVVTNLDDEYAGNAGADNTVHIRLWYRRVPTDI